MAPRKLWPLHCCRRYLAPDYACEQAETIVLPPAPPLPVRGQETASSPGHTCSPECRELGCPSGFELLAHVDPGGNVKGARRRWTTCLPARRDQNGHAEDARRVSHQ